MCLHKIMNQILQLQTDQQRSKCKSDLGKLNPLEKKTRNRTLHERRHSFKQAVIAQNDATLVAHSSLIYVFILGFDSVFLMFDFLFFFITSFSLF